MKENRIQVYSTLVVFFARVSAKDFPTLLCKAIVSLPVASFLPSTVP